MSGTSFRQVAVRKQPNTKSEALRQLPQGEPLGGGSNGEGFSGERVGNGRFGLFWLLCIGVSKNSGTPKMDGVYSGKPYFLMDDSGVPLFLETPIFISQTWSQAIFDVNLKSN